MVGYNDRTPMDVLPYKSHVLYLTSDVVWHGVLYDFLISQLSPGLADYHDRLIAPLTPVLVTMGETGVRLNIEFVRSESIKLEAILAVLSEAHKRRHGRRLPE